MKLRLSRAVLATAALLAALPAAASQAEAGAVSQNAAAVAAPTGAGRQQLLELFAGLEATGGSAELDQVRARLDGLDSRSWARLEELLERNPQWQEIPRILEHHSSLLDSREGFLASRGIAPSTAAVSAGAGQDLERFRAELLFLLRQLHGLAPVMTPGYGERLGRAAVAVEALSPDALEKLRSAYFRQMVQLAERRPELGAGGAATGMTPTTAELFTCPSFSCALSISIPDSCDSFLGVEVCLSDIISLSISIDLCSLSGIDDLLTGVCEDITGFLDDAIADITGAFDTIVDAVNALPAQLEALGELIVDGVLAAIAEALNLLPNEAGELIDMLADAGGFDASDPDWWQSIPGLSAGTAASTAATRSAVVMPLELSPGIAPIEMPNFNLLPPCPARGDVLPVIGEFGSADAELRCRKIDGMLNDIFDLIPGDTKMLALKIAGAFVYFPVNYLCLCAQQQSEVHNINTSLAFHQHAEERMDAVVSHLASASSLGALRGGLTDTALTVDDTNETLLSAIARAEGLDGTVAGQNVFLETLTLLLDRIDLEEALLDVDDGDERLLALPAAQGGRYADVETVVWDTIQGAVAAGQPIHNALFHFNRAQDYEAAGRWSNAYWELQKTYQEAVKSNGGQGVKP